MSDLGMGLLGIPLVIAIVVADYTCTLAMVTDFFVLGFGHLSAYIIGIIGYDRFFRMKYLNNYGSVVKIWKIYISVAVVAFLSFLHGGAHAAGIRHDIYDFVASFDIIVDVAGVPWMLVVF